MTDKVMVSKESVHYREGTPEQHCGNCVMFHSLFRIPDQRYDIGICDLVLGAIMNEDTCDEWEAV